MDNVQACNDKVYPPLIVLHPTALTHFSPGYIYPR